MMPIPRRREEAEEWLKYATEDLETAEILLGPASPKPKQLRRQKSVECANPLDPIELQPRSGPHCIRQSV